VRRGGHRGQRAGGARRAGPREAEADAQRTTHQVFVSLPYFLGVEIKGGDCRCFRPATYYGEYPE
jgi:hypothetical protein